MIVLAFLDYYLPGHKAGGPIRSLSNAVPVLQPEVTFCIVTRDRDLGDTSHYPDLEPDRWQWMAGAETFHASPRTLGMRGIRELLWTKDHNAVYLNSVLSVITLRVLALRWLGLVPRRPTVLAPRGEFSPGALAINRWRKRIYLRVMRAAGLMRGIRWHASSPLEHSDVQRALGGTASTAQVVMAREFFSPPSNPDGTRAPKASGQAKVAFISRISPKKNLLGALRILAGTTEHITFDIYGPAEDPAYWARCQEAVRALPHNVHVTYHGALAYENVSAALAASDLFLLPTFGENFGHVILEALASGCPVLISSETPWRNLEDAGVGWDLPLADAAVFTRVVDEVARMAEAQHAEHRSRATAYAARMGDSATIRQENLDLFLTLGRPRIAPASRLTCP